MILLNNLKTQKKIKIKKKKVAILSILKHAQLRMQSIEN